MKRLLQNSYFKLHNAVIYKTNNFAKRQFLMLQLEENWRKKLKQLIDAVFVIQF